MYRKHTFATKTNYTVKKQLYFPKIQKPSCFIILYNWFVFC